MTPARLAVSAAGLGLLVASWTATTACQLLQSQSCIDVYCESEATIDLRSPTGAWSPGTYQLTVARADGGVDAGQDQCTLQVTDSPSPMSVGLATCTRNLGFELSPVSSCVTIVTDSGASGGECRPLPGQFHETVTIVGTPGEVELTLSRDGQPLLDVPISFTYKENDVGCGGSCRQASVQLSVGAAATDAGPLTD